MTSKSPLRQTTRGERTSTRVARRQTAFASRCAVSSRCGGPWMMLTMLIRGVREFVCLLVCLLTCFPACASDRITIPILLHNLPHEVHSRRRPRQPEAARSHHLHKLKTDMRCARCVAVVSRWQHASNCSNVQCRRSRRSSHASNSIQQSPTDLFGLLRGFLLLSFCHSTIVSHFHNLLSHRFGLISPSACC
ncbi:hypothetical protein F5884DRAFT_438851 [Xylogone sp. PMI_703]|nr:hypothetical protein F5884DRAFT_438851 [Xylogone sp. PMI_703]